MTHACTGADDQDKGSRLENASAIEHMQHADDEVRSMKAEAEAATWDAPEFF